MENDTPGATEKPSKNKTALIGCGLTILFVIALIVILFTVGPEFANPWGDAPGPAP